MGDETTVGKEHASVEGREEKIISNYNIKIDESWENRTKICER